MIYSLYHANVLVAYNFEGEEDTAQGGGEDSPSSPPIEKTLLLLHQLVFSQLL